MSLLGPLLDVVIVTGFSFGVSKAELGQLSFKYRREIVGRERRAMTDDQRLAILRLPRPLLGIPELRMLF